MFYSNKVGRTINGKKQGLVNFWKYEDKHYLTTNYYLEIFDSSHILVQDGYLSDELLEIS